VKLDLNIRPTFALFPQRGIFRISLALPCVDLRSLRWSHSIGRDEKNIQCDFEINPLRRCVVVAR
jgi:hypothetical protein